MIEIKLTGTVEEIWEDVRKLFGCGENLSVSSADTSPAGGRQEVPEQAPAEETPVKAEKAASDEPEAKGEETVAEAAEAAESAPAEAETTAEETTSSVTADAATPSPEGKADEAPAEEAPVITMIEARAKMNDLRQKKGAAAVRMILDQLGCKKFTDVPESDYPKLMVCCEALEHSDAV